MIWRPEYRPRLLRLERLPAVVGSSLSGNPVSTPPVAFVAGVSLAALRPVEVWHRLLVGSFGDEPRIALGYFVAASEIAEAVPRSRHDRTFAWRGLETWEAEVGPLPGEAVLAINLVTRDAVIGPPTEEVWEAFEASVRVALGPG